MLTSTKCCGARVIPGIAAAGLTDACRWAAIEVGVKGKGQVLSEGQVPEAYVRVVSDGYFDAMGIPLIEGRDSRSAMEIRRRTGHGGQPEPWRARFGPGRMRSDRLMTHAAGAVVVGVVGDVRHFSLERRAAWKCICRMRQYRGLWRSWIWWCGQRCPRPNGDGGARGAPAGGSELAGERIPDPAALVDKAVSPRRFVVMLLAGIRRVSRCCWRRWGFTA